MNEEHNLTLESCFDFNEHAKHPEAEDLIWRFISMTFLFSEENTYFSLSLLFILIDRSKEGQGQEINLLCLTTFDAQVFQGPQ